MATVPTSLYLQTYPYLSEGEQQRHESSEECPPGVFGRDQNCLLYCETTGGRPLPQNKRLAFSGNLAAAAVGGKDGGKEGFDGTFAVDGRLFVTQHVLPSLQVLCAAMQFTCLPPDFFIDEQNFPT